MSIRRIVMLFAIIAAIAMLPAPARAQVSGWPAMPFLTESRGTGSESSDVTPADLATINPLRMLAEAGDTLRGFQDRTGGTPSNSSGGGDGRTGGLSGPINVLIVLTVISLVPTIMLMTTCFVRIVVVLGLLKQAIGTQTLPPPQVIVALAMFMTLLVMSPTIERVNKEAIAPYQAGKVKDYDELWARVKQPVRDFMFDQIEATGNWSAVYMILNYRGVDTSRPEKLSTADVDMVSLVPAFLLSELKTGFLIGFKIYLPFLVIDMVISAILLSMGMMMLPPVLISLPFKLLLFVLVDGWQLVVGSLLQSFVTHPTPATAWHTLDPPWILHAVSSVLC